MKTTHSSAGGCRGSDKAAEVGLPAACLGVIMPCYNEMGTVDAITGRVLAEAVVAELIAVDDGSTDGTGQCLEAWARREARVRFLRHEANRGKGAAIRTGLAAARAPVVIIQDADLEYDPGDYARLVEPIQRGETEVVYGSRFMTETAACATSCRRAESIAAAAKLGFRGCDLLREGTG